jgi:hypothetical protein
LVFRFRGFGVRQLLFRGSFVELCSAAGFLSAPSFYGWCCDAPLVARYWFRAPRVALAYFSSHLGFFLRFFTLLQLHSLSKIVAALAFFLLRTSLSFDVLCASLEVLFPSAFAVSGACISQAFRA